MEKNAKNPLAGKWIFLKLEHKSSDDRWELTEYFPASKLIWDFQPQRTINQEFHGTLQCKFRGDKPQSAGFCYFADDAQLYVDVSDCAADDPQTGYYEDRYRAVKTGRRRMILYVLEDVCREPEDYYYRLVLCRHTPLATIREMIRSVFVKKAVARFGI